MKYFIVHVGGNQTAKQFSIQLGCQIIVDYSWAETINQNFQETTVLSFASWGRSCFLHWQPVCTVWRTKLLFKRSHSHTKYALLHTKIYLF